MTLSVLDIPVPLRADASGVLRVGNTRVSLRSVVTAYLEGASVEQIAEDFSTLELPDIYAVISYYLRNRDEVERYLDEEQRDADMLRDEIRPVVALPRNTTEASSTSGRKGTT
jgi:uncharacterized protein (DUF433 family)